MQTTAECWRHQNNSDQEFDDRPPVEREAAFLFVYHRGGRVLQEDVPISTHVNTGGRPKSKFGERRVESLQQNSDSDKTEDEDEEDDDDVDNDDESELTESLKRRLSMGQGMEDTVVAAGEDNGGDKSMNGLGY
eukprot:Selendium_serpulae@DN1009_c0_g1_i1.p1